MFLLLKFSEIAQPNEVEKLSQKTVGGHSIFLASFRCSRVDKIHERFDLLVVEIIPDSFLWTQTEILVFEQDGNAVGNAQFDDNDRTQSPVIFFRILLILGFQHSNYCLLVNINIFYL